VHVLIIGEIGTGKYSSVRFVYEKGIDPSKPLVIVDAAELIKSENETRKVDSLLMEKFLEANGGLLYISDIDRLNNIVQSELLNIFTKQNRDENFTQIILSSKISLDQLENILIPKFYSILQKNIVLLPALKGRSEQIISFAYHFLNFANFAFNKNIQGLDSEIQDLFSSYDWPGNIQELKNTILKAAMITEGDVISIDIADELFGTNKLETGEKSRFNINSLKKENYEKEKIYKALVLAKGNKTMAASILNIDRKTLYNKIKLYNVKI
jgi:two-component system response regulator HydG